MPLQNFQDKNGPPISAAWLNQIDTFVNTLFAGATTQPQALSALLSGVVSTPPASAAAWVSAIDQGSLTNIIRYGAVPGLDAGGAVNSAASSVEFPSGSWLLTTTPNPPAGDVIVAKAGSSFSGAGATAIGINVQVPGQQIIEVNSSANDFATSYVRRNANHTGGTVGRTEAAFRADSFVGANVTNFEWTGIFTIFNSATGGQNVALYAQGNRQTTSTGPTWAGVMEVIDNSGNVNPTQAIIGLEIDARGVGADLNANRVPLHIVGSRPSGGGAAATIGIGILIDNNADGINTSYGTGIFLGNKLGGTCTFNIGIDLAQGTFSSGAIRMPAGSPILFDAAGVNQFSFTNSGLQYNVSGTSQAQFGNAGSISYGGSGLPIKMLGTTALTATAGAAGAPPATVSGYKIEVINGTTVKVPYYAN